VKTADHFILFSLNPRRKGAKDLERELAFAIGEITFCATALWKELKERRLSSHNTMSMQLVLLIADRDSRGGEIAAC